MIRELFAFLLLFILSGGAVVFAQQSGPQEKRKAERSIQLMGIIEDGGFLGVEPEEVTKTNFSKYGLSEARGVAIEKVVENSPAQQAGLQSGDVITMFNGEEVTSVRKLMRLISETAPDHQAKISILRAGNERNLTATIGKRPMPKFETGTLGAQFPTPDGEAIFKKFPWPQGDYGREGGVAIFRGGPEFAFGSASRRIGIQTSPLTKQLGEYFGVDEGKGLLIKSVNENSPASKAGLKAGDVVVEIEGKEIKNSVDLIKGLNEKKEGEVTLTVVRERNRQTFKLTPEKAEEATFRFEDLGKLTESLKGLEKFDFKFEGLKGIAPKRIL